MQPQLIMMENQKMSNRFTHITSRTAQVLPEQVSLTRETESAKKRIGRDVFDTLMGLLAEDSETPTTPYGVLVANSTKRKLKREIEALFTA